MSIIIDIEVFGFTGFYQGIWDQSENEQNEIHEMKYGEYEDFESLHMIEDWGFPEDYRDRVAELFADEYADMVSSAIGINVKLVKSFVRSPREYNFSTDEIYAQIEIEDYDEFAKRLQYFLKSDQYRGRLAEIIRENHTSCSGFISFMSNDIDKWYELIEDPNNETYISCLVEYIVVVVDENRAKLLNNTIYEFVCSNTDLHCVKPITDIAKDEWLLYEQYGSLYTKYADEHPLRYPDKWEWKNYKTEFLSHAEEFEKELKRKEFERKYQLCLDFKDY